jgi:hypothetical protein
LPNVLDLFPELRDAERLDADEAPSCSAAAAQAAQDLFINRRVAVAASDLLWQLVRPGRISAYGFFINPTVTRVSPEVCRWWCVRRPGRRSTHRACLTKTARHAWLSSQPLSHANVHERCNLGARHRWGIEAGFLVERHQGYHYEHAFARNWNAMKGDHSLMRLAHLFNTLARFARHLRDLYRQLGVRGTIAFIRTSWLDPARMRRLLTQPLQLQLE